MGEDGIGIGKWKLRAFELSETLVLGKDCVVVGEKSLARSLEQ